MGTILQDLKARGIDNTLNADYNFIDADTIKDNEGNSFRLQGVDAPEISKAFSPTYTQDTGTAGGTEATISIQNLARKQGFTNVVKLTDANGDPIMDATGERQMIELHNDKGENFTTRLLQSGVLKSGGYTRQQDLDAMHVSDIFGDEARRDGDGEWAAAADKINAAMIAEGHDSLNFRQQAVNERQRAQAPHLYSAATQFRDYDRNLDNSSRNPLSDAWDIGWEGVTESAYGLAELVGDTAEIESLSKIGENGIYRARARMADVPSFIVDSDEIEDVGSAFEWLGTNIAMSLPYMAITMAGAAASPFTGGLSMLAPVGVYTGQTWNEMEGEKSAAIAVGAGIVQATLDRLGLSGIVSMGGAPKEILKKATDTLISRGIAPEVAKQQVAQATRLEMAKLAGDAAKIAAQQVQAKKIVKDLIKRGIISGASEGVTEALQETTAYLAATSGSDKQFSWDELAERAQKAAIAGSVIGGAFTIPGTAYDAGAWADVALRQAPADAKRLSEAGRYAEEEMENEGRIMSIQEIAAEMRAAPEATSSLETRIEAHNTDQKNRTWEDTIGDTITSAPALWQGATRFIFKPEILSASRTARKLADMFGGQLQRTFSGSSYENSKHHKVSIYRNMVDTPETLWANIIGKDRSLFTRNAKVKASQHIYKTLRGAINPKTKKFDARKIPQGTKNRQYIMQLGRQLNALSDKMYTDQAKYNPDLGYIDNYLFRYKSFDRRAIDKNQLEFIDALTTEFKDIDRDTAKKIVDQITGNENVTDFAEAFSAVTGDSTPQAHKKRTLALSENPKFERFMQQDILANVSEAARSAARFTAQQEFVGEQGKHIAKMLDQIEKEGVDPKIVNRMAKQMKDYLDAEAGNYKRPTTETGKKFQKMQRNFMSLTMLAGLPLATISSFVELALTMKALNTDQLWGKDGGLAAIGKEFGKGFWNGAMKGRDLIVGEYADRTGEMTKGQQRLQDLGYYAWDVGAATTTGATETNPTSQQWIDMYFKAIGLQQWTDYTRAIRASIAGDYIRNHTDTIINAQGEAKTNAVQEAEEALRNLGINLPRYINGLQTNPQYASTPEFADMIREAQFNFINDAVALPQSANRPLFYQDPRFALFTQFQGFIATFTANHIPKLWGEYVKRGTPQMKYSAFATMATMIVLGFASQELKDRIKHAGEENPYLDFDEKVQRGIRASGLLGTGERILDQFFPIYEDRSKNAGEWLWNTGSGESPALSNLERIGKASGKLLEGDVGEASRNLLKATPGFGPFSAVNSYIGEKMSAWNWKE